MANLEERIKIDQKIRKIDGKLASQELLNLGLTATASASVNVAKDGTVTFTVITEHAEGLQIFATEHFSLYETAVLEANKIPGGDDIGVNDYETAFWYDWGTTDDKNVVFIVWLHNRSGAAQNILLRVNTRFIIEAASSAT